MDANVQPMTATPVMGTVGLSWIDVEEQVRHVVNLLEAHGDTVLSLVTGSLKLIKAVTARDLVTVFVELNAASVNIQALIAAIKLEFSL